MLKIPYASLHHHNDFASRRNGRRRKWSDRRGRRADHRPVSAIPGFSPGEAFYK